MASILTIPVPKDTNAGTKIELQKRQGCAISSGDKVVEPKLLAGGLPLLSFLNMKSLIN